MPSVNLSTGFPLKKRRAIKILFVIGTLEVGGAETHLVRLARDLKAKGWGPEIFVFKKRGPLEAFARKHQIPVHTPSPPAEWINRLSSKLVFIQAFVFILLDGRSLRNVVRKQRPQILHFFLPGAYITGAIATFFFRGIKRIMSRRSLNFYQKGNPLFRMAEHWLHPFMDKVSGNSRAILDDLRSEGIPESKVHLIYNGVEVLRQAPRWKIKRFRRNLRIQNKAFLMVVLANLIPYKGHEDLIQALALVQKSLPQPWVLICAGRNDGIQTRLEDLASSFGIKSRIRFLGAVSDVRTLLLSADIGILSSHQEGFSNAILEYMAAGLPVVATRVGGNPEAVIDGKTGFLASPGDPVALAKSILRLAKNPKRKAMGHAGKQRVRMQFTQKQCVELYEKMYRQSLFKS